MGSQTVINAPAVPQRREAKKNVVKKTLWFADHWLLLFILLFGAYWITPFLAPVFMRLGWTGAAQVIYSVYSTQCHQMAQRSFFLFGRQPMYNIAELPVPVTGDEITNMLALRAFIGNADLGWKVAWSDRMVYMYGGIWFASIALWVIRQYRSVEPLKWSRVLLLSLLIVPMVVDGATHWLSDVTGGLVGGFRYTNQWLVTLTGHALPTWFYMGDAFGSFNSWMRLISGILFGLAVASFVLPYMDLSMRDAAETMRDKLARAGSLEIAN